MSTEFKRSAGLFYVTRVTPGYFPTGGWRATAAPHFEVGYFPVDPISPDRYSVPPGKKTPGAPERLRGEMEAGKWLRENVDRVNAEVLAQTGVAKVDISTRL